MSANLVIFILIQLAALVFFAETMRRVNKRADEYELKDTRRTILFGFIHLRHVVVLYILSYVIWLTASILIYMFFIDPYSSSSGSEIPSFDLHF